MLGVSLVGLLPCLFFFFQAEDGIRDLLVTGVQTCALPICSGCELVVEAGESAGPGREGRPAGIPVGVEADDVDGGGGEGVLETDLGQAAIAGPAEAGDVEGLVDGALDPGAQGVLGLPGLAGLLGPGTGQGLVEFPGAEAEHAGASRRGGALVLGRAGVAVGAGELDDDGVAAVLPDGEPAGAGAALWAAGLADRPVDAEGALLVPGVGLGLW